MSRNVSAEGMGTGLLLYVIVGSGIAAESLSGDHALQLLSHALVVGLALAVLIVLFQPVSGSHFNPSVTLGFWMTRAVGRRTAFVYFVAQVFGGIAGVVLANVTFDLPALAVSTTARDGIGQLAAEAVATFVLVLVILCLVRAGRDAAVPAAVGAWVATIVFASSSTGFANPAVTVARTLTDSYTGIAPASVAGFLAAQLLAGLAAALVAPRFDPDTYPDPSAREGETMPVTLTTAEQLRVREAAERLRRRFAGQLESGTIERFMNDSLVTSMGRATDSTWVPLLAERLARDRLRAVVRLESDATSLNPGVLFLCIHNAGRSQMAAGWMRHLGGEGVEVFSAGSEPADVVNQAAVAAMAERGIDISGEIPQPWADEIVRAVDVVVTMGCGDACPFFPGKRYIDWEIEDPSGKTVEGVRPIRDDIEQRVRNLMAELDIPIAVSR